MEKQLIFRERYVFQLKKNVEDGENIELYRSKEFIYDKKATLMMPNIKKPENLVLRLDVDNDFATAVQIYEAYKDLEPIQASDERLWTYLSHVDLYPYMVKRWNSITLGTAKDSRNYILSHWFLKSTTHSELLRHALSGLWWAIHLSVDESRGERKYELSEVLFRQLDFTTRTLGTYNLGRHKEAVIGILEFIKENEDLFKKDFQGKARYITKHLDLIGGVKPISFFGRQFFKDELKKISKNIAAFN